jgi:hypothetical protein
MYLIRNSAVSCAVLLALTPPAGAGSTRAPILGISSPYAQIERSYYRCHGQYEWVPDGTIAGQTGGYPYYGWYGYPYVPYRCVHLRHGHYNYYGQPT